MLGIDFEFLLVELKSLFNSPFLYYLLFVFYRLTLSRYGYGVLSLLATGNAKLLVLGYFFKPPFVLVDFFNSGVLIVGAGPIPLLKLLLAEALLAKNFLLLI